LQEEEVFRKNLVYIFQIEGIHCVEINLKGASKWVIQRKKERKIERNSKVGYVTNIPWQLTQNLLRDGKAKKS
jgi:hypothetical protein